MFMNSTLLNLKNCNSQGIAVFPFLSKFLLLIAISLFCIFSTLNAQNLNKAVDLATADPGQVFEYTLDFTCPSTVNGDCENVNITLLQL